MDELSPLAELPATGPDRRLPAGIRQAFVDVPVPDGSEVAGPHALLRVLSGGAGGVLSTLQMLATPACTAAYSHRNAASGSTRMARRAGRYAAARATASSTRGDTASVTPSHGPTSNSSPEMSRAIASPAPSPTPTPSSVQPAASPRIIANSAAGRAPSAMRMPISRV